MIKDRTYHLREISSAYSLVFVDTCGFLADNRSVNQEIKIHRASAASALEYFTSFVGSPEGNNIFTIPEIAIELGERNFPNKKIRGVSSTFDSSHEEYLNIRDGLLTKLTEKNKVISKRANPRFGDFFKRYSVVRQKFGLSPEDYALLISSLVSSYDIPTAGISNDGHLLGAYKFVACDLSLKKEKFNFFSHYPLGEFKSSWDHVPMVKRKVS